MPRSKAVALELAGAPPARCRYRAQMTRPRGLGAAELFLFELMGFVHTRPTSVGRDAG